MELIIKIVLCIAFIIFVYEFFKLISKTITIIVIAMYKKHLKWDFTEQVLLLGISGGIILTYLLM